MNTKASTEKYELDNEPDEISSPLTPPNGFNGSTNGSGKILEEAGSSGLGKDEITLEDEKELAGYNDDLTELLTKEYRIKQDEEEPEERSTSEKPSVRTLSVLAGTAAIMGVVGFVWFGFLAPKPARQQASNPSPSPTPTPLKDESAELKGKLAFQDQRRQLETKPDVQRQRSTPTSPQSSPSPVAKVTPPPQPVRQTPTIPPPPRTVFVRQPSYPPLQPALQAVQSIQPIQPVPPAPRAEPSSAVDPFERWSQLASLGQTRGLTTRETASNSEGQSTTQRSAYNASPAPTIRQQQSTQQDIPTISIGYTPVSDNLTVSKTTGMTNGEMGILTRSSVNQNSRSGQRSPILEVAIGTSVNARVVVPMLWDESGKSPTN